MGRSQGHRAGHGCLASPGAHRSRTWGEPSAGILDSQSTKGADTVGRPTRGHDAGKKVNGRKRFIVTDTLGLVVCVMAASVQDRDRARTTLLSLYLATPVRFVFADARFARALVAWTSQDLIP